MAKQFRYVDLAALTEFLTKLKYSLANNSSSSFQVNYADKADKDSSGSVISTTYLKVADASLAYVPLERTIAGVSLENNISKDSLLSALNVADGAQVNVLEGISFKGNGDSDFADLTITNKKAILDLSGYALKSEVARVMKFKGSKTGAEIRALTSANVENGDVYTCSADDKTTTPYFLEGFEYVATVDGSSVSWTELGKNFQGMASEEWVTSQISAASSALQANIDDIYKNDGGTESGVLMDKIAALDAAEVGGSGKYISAISETDGVISATAGTIDTAVTSGSSNLVTSGAVSTAISGAIAALDASDVAGDYVTAVTETDGVITVTKATKGAIASGVTTLVDGGSVYAAIEAAKSDADIDIKHDAGDAAGTFKWKTGAQASYTTVNTGAEANVIDGVKVTNNVAEGGAHTTTTLTPDASKDVTIDLGAYALEADLEAVTTSEIDGLFTV